ncbi:MAG: hypothetical protein BGO78_02210 [Chloroflexi bacterium 44-23]|nr:MAG: hypothetical protein BGO78_02210 [Chloroflexi bacterium 44-23]
MIPSDIGGFAVFSNGVITVISNEDFLSIRHSLFICLLSIIVDIFQVWIYSENGMLFQWGNEK